jgi:hypothetical protein
MLKHVLKLAIYIPQLCVSVFLYISKDIVLLHVKLGQSAFIILLLLGALIHYHTFMMCCFTISSLSVRIIVYMNYTQSYHFVLQCFMLVHSIVSVHSILIYREGS